MDVVVPLLVLSTLSQLAVTQPEEPQNPIVQSVTSLQAEAEVVSGEARIFSGENVRLKCSVHDVYGSTWDYEWFKGSEQLPQLGEYHVLWRAYVKYSGKYYCRGVRKTVVGKIYTHHSLPIEITVDGGWAILQVPALPSLVGNPFIVTCRVRGSPELHEVILYRNGVEVMRQTGHNPHFEMNLTLEDQGMYSCRASWDENRYTRSVISAGTPVQVLEVLSEPILEIDVKVQHISADQMKLVCHHQYNAHAPAPPASCYFYRNDNQLGPATSKNYIVVKKTPDQYSCKVKVPLLGLTRWSAPKNFGQVADLFLFPETKPTAAQPSPRPSTTSPIFMQPTEMSTQASGPKPTPSTPLSSIQSFRQFAPTETVDIYEESGDMSEESGDMSEESGDMSEESGDMSEESGDMSVESGDMSGESGDMPTFW